MTYQEYHELEYLVEQYGDERSCVTFNGWSKRRDPEEILEEIKLKLSKLITEDY